MGSSAGLGAAELITGFKTLKRSPVEVMRDVLARVEACEPHIKALYAPDPESALKAAAASEARWAKGAPLSAIDGLPCTIKENLATKGTPVPLGTAAMPLVPALADSPPAARLLEAGAICFAKTTMPDFGMLSSGLSSFHPLTRNPWDFSKNPGGSSSGAAAAAAAGYGPLHIGTDIGGSIRLPASWCGLFGLKPSAGRIPIDPPYLGRVAGPLTRTVDDAAVMMPFLTKPDRRDHMSLPYQDLDWQTRLTSAKGLKIGLMMDAGCGLPVEPEVRAAVEAAAKAFAAAGADIVEMKPFLTRAMLEGIDAFWRTRAWSDVSQLPESIQQKILPFIFNWAKGAEGMDGLKVFRGFEQNMVIRRAGVVAFADVDFALSPTAPMPAFDAHLPCPTNDPDLPFEHICYTLGFNMTEQPAASVNCGYTSSGLPIGLQIIGQRFDDVGVMALSRLYEELRPAQRAWPSVV